MTYGQQERVGEHEAGDIAFDYAKIADSDAEQAREDLVKTKGFFVLPSELFENVHASAKDDENLNETLERIFSNIEGSAQGTDSEDNLTDLFDDCICQLKSVPHRGCGRFLGPHPANPRLLR